MELSEYQIAWVNLLRPRRTLTGEPRGDWFTMHYPLQTNPIFENANIFKIANARAPISGVKA